MVDQVAELHACGGVLRLGAEKHYPRGDGLVCRRARRCLPHSEPDKLHQRRSIVPEQADDAVEPADEGVCVGEDDIPRSRRESHHSVELALLVKELEALKETRACKPLCVKLCFTAFAVEVVLREGKEDLCLDVNDVAGAHKLLWLEREECLHKGNVVRTHKDSVMPREKLHKPSIGHKLAQRNQHKHELRLHRRHGKAPVQCLQQLPAHGRSTRRRGPRHRARGRLHEEDALGVLVGRLRGGHGRERTNGGGQRRVRKEGPQAHAHIGVGDKVLDDGPARVDKAGGVRWVDVCCVQADVPDDTVEERGVLVHQDHKVLECVGFDVVQDGPCLMCCAHRENKCKEAQLVGSDVD